MKTNRSFSVVIILGAFALFCGQPLTQAQTNGPGSAVDLDGTNDYVQAPSAVWFNGPFTVESWVFVRSYNSWSRLIDFGNGQYLHNVYLAVSEDTTGFPKMGIFNTANNPLVGSSQQLPLNQWAHLAATYDGTSGTIYINGTNVGTGPLSTPPPNVLRTNNFIGRSNWDGADARANAIFDELRIWRVARTPAQINATMRYSLPPSDTNLVANWKFNEGAGTLAADSSSNARTGTLFSATWTNSTAPIVTGFGNAVTLDIGQDVEIPHHTNLNAYPFTVMTWFKTTDSGGALVNKYVSSSYNGYQMFISGGGTLVGWYLRNSTDTIFAETAGAPPVNDGQWHHAAFTVEASGGRLYLDGVLRGSIAWSGTPGAVTTTQKVSMGHYPGDSLIGGQFDEMSLWNTALSAQQIRLYATRGLVGTETNLLAYYRFDEGVGTNASDATTRGNTGTLMGGASWTNSPLQPTFTARTTGAGAITTTSALLSGAVNPLGLNTGVWFEYGLTTNYGSVSTPTNLTDGFILETPLALSLANLQLSSAGTLYHYRIIATNSSGVRVGGDQTFMTVGGTPTVTSLADDGPNSLRQLIALTLDGDTITFATNGTITLTNGELVVTKSFNLIGPGVTNLSISATNNSRVFRFVAGTTNRLSNLTIRDGKATSDLDGAGGGIYNEGTLTMSNCIISFNQAAPGPAGTVSGSFPVITVTPGGPGKMGGGIFNSGMLQLDRCYLSSNTGGPGGAGVNGNIQSSILPSRGGLGGNAGALLNAGQAVLSGCTFAGNAGGSGGRGGTGYFGSGSEPGGDGGSFGILYNTGTITFTLCTMDSNPVGPGGPGAVFSQPPFPDTFGPGGNPGTNGSIYNSGTITLIASTITRNSGGGIFNTWFATARSSIIALNGPGNSFDYHGPFSSQGHNLIGNNDGSFGFFVGANNDLVGTLDLPIDPLLAPLANNGGNWPTVALLPGSPALDTGDDLLLASPFYLSTDQRGQPRKIGTQVDIGAYEAALFTPLWLTGAGLGPDQSFAFLFTNTPGGSFTVLTSTNAASPLESWTVLGAPDEIAVGVFRFFTPTPATNRQQFFRVRTP